MADGIDRLGPLSVQPRLPAHLHSPRGERTFPDVDGREEPIAGGEDLDLSLEDDGDPAERRRRDRVTISAEARRLFRGAAGGPSRAAPAQRPERTAEAHGGTLDVTV